MHTHTAQDESCVMLDYPFICVHMFKHLFEPVFDSVAQAAKPILQRVVIVYSLRVWENCK